MASAVTSCKVLPITHLHMTLLLVYSIYYPIVFAIWVKSNIHNITCKSSLPASTYTHILLYFKLNGLKFLSISTWRHITCKSFIPATISFVCNWSMIFILCMRTEGLKCSSINTRRQGNHQILVYDKTKFPSSWWVKSS